MKSLEDSIRYQYKDKNYYFEILYKFIKTTCFSAKIKDDKIFIIAPENINLQKVSDFLYNSINKILPKYLDQQEKVILLKPNQFYLFGKLKTYKLISNRVLVEECIIGKSNNLLQTKKIIDKFLADQLLEYIISLHKKWEYIFTQKPVKISIVRAKSYWGINSVLKNHIRYSLNLSHQNLYFIEYVVIHELAHCVHSNHSKEFWKLVKKHCPDYTKIRKEIILLKHAI